MRTRDLLVILGVVAAPLFACSSSDSTTDTTDGGTAGSGGGTVKDGGTAGTGGAAGTGGTAGSGGTAGTGGGTAGTGGGTAGTGGSAQGCGFTTGDTTCDDCLTASCCDSETACANDTTCSDCETSQTPASSCSSNALVTAFETCAMNSCKTQCTTSSDGGTTGDAGDCTTCETTNCSSEITACKANADCKTVATCVSKCTDQACYDACETTTPGGKTDFDNFYKCMETNCATACAG